MALQPCKILSLTSPNQFVIQTQQQKVITVGNGIQNFLIRSNTQINKNALDLYYQQLAYLNKEALYVSKTNSIQINGVDLIKNIADEEQIYLNLIAVKNEEPHQTQQVTNFIRTMRNKQVNAILVSFEKNILNFLYNQDTLISVIPNEIYIDDFGSQDLSYVKLMQKEFLSKEFELTFKGQTIMTVNHQGKFVHFPILKAELHLKQQANIELSNEFYSALVSEGHAYITDLGKVNLSRNSFQLLYQCQEEAKKNNLGMWKNGELDRKTLNSVSSQQMGKVVQVLEANHYLIRTDEETLNIKLDRIFVEGLEAKEFARKLLIGKQVHILQVGENIPLFTIQLVENNLDIEEELISNGWATAKENHPNLSKFKYQQFQQLNQQAKQRRLGQYSPELTWRIEDQTEQNQGKNVNEIIWSGIQREKQQAKQSGVTTGIQIKEDYHLEVLVDKILLNGLFHVTLLKFHSMINFQISGTAKFSDFVTSFPDIAKYEEQRQKFTYDLLMQRNAWVQVDSFNIHQNIFAGKLYLKKNNKDSDFTISLLSEGLSFLQGNNDYYSKYEEAQNKAIKEKKGFWTESYAQFIQDFSQNKQKLKKQISTQVKINDDANLKVEEVLVTALSDCNEFYVRKENNPQFDELSAQIEKTELVSLKKPVKRGTLCLAIYSLDGAIYRAQIVQDLKKDNYLVKFIDYGNIEEVNYKDLGVLPPQFTSIPQQAKLCTLAYLRFPPQSHEFAEEAADQLRELILDQLFECKVIYTEKSSNKQFVTLQAPGQQDELQFTINRVALEKGLGRIDHKVLYNPLKEFKELETEAKSNGVGLWAFDDCLEDEKQFEDEYDYY